MAVFISYLWSILSAVSDNPSTYGMTATVHILERLAEIMGRDKRKTEKK